MHVPQDTNVVYVVFKLMDRGLTEETIDRALKHMVGNDWREIRIALWHKRLQDKGFIFTVIEDLNSLIDEIETLVNGKTKLDPFFFRGYDFRRFNRPGIQHGEGGRQ